MTGMPSTASRRFAGFVTILMLSSCVAVLPLSDAAAKAPVIPSVIAESARTVPGGRSVRVEVSQPELRWTIGNSVVGATAVGGVFGTLVGVSIDSANGKTAEERITPIRDALLDFDTDGLAIETTRNALSKVDWMQPGDIGFTRDSSFLGRANFVNAGTASQAAFFLYSYEMASDFSHVRVMVSLQFVNKMPPADNTKAATPFPPVQPVYTQGIVCDVALPKAGNDAAANAALWAADDGKLMKQALTMAFADVQGLIPRALDLTDADVALMNGADKPMQTVDGFNGHVVEAADNHLLIWNSGFIQADTLPQNP